MHDGVTAKWTNPTGRLGQVDLAEDAYAQRLYDAFNGDLREMMRSRQAHRDHISCPKILNCWSTVNAQAAIDAAKISDMTPTQLLQAAWKVEIEDPDLRKKASGGCHEECLP